MGDTAKVKECHELIIDGDHFKTNTAMESRIDGLEKSGCRIDVHASGVTQSSSEGKRN
jgi:hypothetical protein